MPPFVFMVRAGFRTPNYSILHSWKTTRPQIQSRLSVLILELKYPSFFIASKTMVSTLILPTEVAQIYVKLTASDSFQDYDDADRENNQATVDSGVWHMRTITRGATDRTTKYHLFHRNAFCLRPRCPRVADRHERRRNVEASARTGGRSPLPAPDTHPPAQIR